MRTTALTARIGSLVGICFSVCFVTGLLSHYQYHPWSWLPEPASPVFLYRVTQGVHVATGIATIPLLLVKLWSVYPNLFRWPPARTVKHAVERASVFLLVSSAMIQLLTGFLNLLGWYAWPWSFVTVHYLLAFVVIGSILIHVGVKLPDINYGLRAKLAEADVLTEIPWSENPAAHSNAGTVAPPSSPALNRRGLLIATGAGVGLVVATTLGQTLTPLQPIGLLAIRQSKKGPQRVPVNRTADAAGVMKPATDGDWHLQVAGPRSYRLSLAEIEEMAEHEAQLPINCVEGWSVGAHWRGLRLLDVVKRAGGDAGSRVHVVSLETRGSYHDSYVDGPQVSKALLATHLNGERLVLDHGYPLRLIAPNRAGVLNTKWLSRIEVTLMKTYRYGLVAAGLLVLAYGAVRLIVQVPGDLPGLALWMVGVVVIHDAVLSPLIVGLGWILARTLPPRGRRYVQSALITGGLITIIALPMIHRQGTQPASKALLLQNYTANLAVLLAIVAVLNLIGYAVATIRDRRAASHSTATPIT